MLVSADPSPRNIAVPEPGSVRLGDSAQGRGCLGPPSHPSAALQGFLPRGRGQQTVGLEALKDHPVSVDTFVARKLPQATQRTGVVVVQ